MPAQSSAPAAPSGRSSPGAGRKDRHSIVQIREWPTTAVVELLVESEEEGFRFVRRAQEEWRSGANRFAEEGEAFFGVFEETRLLAIGGINREAGRCGRLRRFYVRRDERGKGIGRQLAEHVLEFARHHYSQVALRCDTDAADRFSRALGFSRTAADAGVTHVLELQKWPAPSPPPTPSGGGAHR